MKKLTHLCNTSKIFKKGKNYECKKITMLSFVVATALNANEATTG